MVMDHGKVVAVGTRAGGETPHDQLLRSCGLYVDIVNTQIRSAEAASKEVT